MPTICSVQPKILNAYSFCWRICGLVDATLPEPETQKNLKHKLISAISLKSNFLMALDIVSKKTVEIYHSIIKTYLTEPE